MKLSSARMITLVLLVFAIMCSFTLQLMRYQITDGEGYRTVANQTSVQSTEIVAPRGEILDRFGRVIATNVVGYTVVLEKAAFPNDKSGNQNDGILQLTNILAKNNMQWADTLPISKTQPFAFNQGSDAAVKSLRTFITQKDTSSTKDAKKKKELEAQDLAATAEQLLAKLKTRYQLRSGFTKEQERIIIGVRYEMEIRDYSIKGTFTLATNVSLDAVTQISELSNSLHGIVIGNQFSRTYPDGTLAPQVIGTVGPIYATEFAALKAKGYSLDDVVGKGGIESSMESYLRGINGLENIEIDTKGNIVERNKTLAEQPGNNVMLTIDMDLQKYLQDALPVIIQQVITKAKGDTNIGASANAAAAVVLNIKTGEVLAMASYPSYDLNTYYQNYSAIVSNPAKPLMSRGIQGLYRPGSAYKPCVATAGLIYGVITPTSTIKTESHFIKGTYSGYDEAGGPTYNVIQALAVSSNFFFNTVADRLYMGGLYTKFEDTAKALGLGQKTGIELPNEWAGVISGPTEKKADGRTWYPADAAQSGIGQLDNQYTPLQLAQYVATICNKGARTQVHIVKSVKSYDNSKTLLENTVKITTDLKIPDIVVQTVKDGMLAVTESAGTANSVFQGFPLQIGGKTGTAQESNAGYNGVFISFAPYNDPQIAVAVVMEHGHNGYQNAPVARDAFNYYFVHDAAWATSPDKLPDATVALPVAAYKLLH